MTSNKRFAAPRNACNQRLATAWLSIPFDSIASPLHCLVRTASSLGEGHAFGINASLIARAVDSETPGHPTTATVALLLLVKSTLWRLRSAQRPSMRPVAKHATSYALPHSRTLLSVTITRRS